MNKEIVEELHFAKLNKGIKKMIKFVEIDVMKVGQKVLISPELTDKEVWISGIVIKIDENSFVGKVISAEAEDGDVYFGYKELFKLTEEEICLP